MWAVPRVRVWQAGIEPPPPTPAQNELRTLERLVAHGSASVDLWVALTEDCLLTSGETEPSGKTEHMVGWKEESFQSQPSETDNGMMTGIEEAKRESKALTMQA